MEGRRRRRCRRLRPGVGYDSEAAYSVARRATHRSEQGWSVLRSKKVNYRAVTKGDSRKEVLEWLDGGHWSSFLLALMGSGLS